ncbi:MAG: hypothetical protein MI750_16190 [Xanthomonadales bacterium]|nr:hypothetical protein [Xanthomonadales bacterium]
MSERQSKATALLKEMGFFASAGLLLTGLTLASAACMATTEGAFESTLDVKRTNGARVPVSALLGSWLMK